MTESKANWFDSDDFLFRWVGHRTKNTKILYKKAWKRWQSFLEGKGRWNPTPEELVIDYTLQYPGETPSNLATNDAQQESLSSLFL